MSMKSMKSNGVSRRRLRLEQLDPRLCLSADPVFDQGVLTIGGSRTDDSIQINDNGRGIIAVVDADTHERWEFRGVERIVVDSGAGDDTIRFTRRGGDSPIPELDIKSGEGDDDVGIGLLLPAVQKVREAAARMHVDLGDGNDRLQVNSTGVGHVDLDIAAGDGDDDVGVGLLLPAVQKVREAAARMHVDLGGGGDRLRLNAAGVDHNLDLDVLAGEGDDNVAIGLLLPAVQKVREAAARMHVDLGGGNDRLQANVAGVDSLDLDISAGEGNDDVGIGLLLPAVQKVREAAARMHVDLSAGGDRLRLNAAGVDSLDLDVLAGEGDDDVAVGLLLPAVQKVREAAARMHIDLGDGNDRLAVNAAGIDQVGLDIAAGDGDDNVTVGLLLPAVQKVREAAARMRIDLGPGADRLRVRTRGYDQVSTDVVSDEDDVIDVPTPRG